MARTGMLRVPARFGMRGLGDAANILAQEQSNVTQHMDPAFLAAQALELQNECAVAPWSPACQVAQVTNDVNVGYNPVADTQLNLENFCQENQANNATFGTPLDTVNCRGPVANPALLTQAATIAQQAAAVSRGPGSGTQGGGPVMTVTPSASPAAAPVPLAVNPPPTTVQNSTLNPGNNASTDLLPPGALNTAESWIQQNWLLLAAGAAAIFLLPSLMKKGGH